MGVFPEYERATRCFLPNYDNTKQVATFTKPHDFEVQMYPVRKGREDDNIMGNDYGRWGTHIKVPTGHKAKKGMIMIRSLEDGTFDETCDCFEVVTEPRFSDIFGEWGLQMKEIQINSNLI
jgi:hypothetical protein